MYLWTRRFLYREVIRISRPDRIYVGGSVRPQKLLFVQNCSYNVDILVYRHGRTFVAISLKDQHWVNSRCVWFVLKLLDIISNIIILHKYCFMSVQVPKLRNERSQFAVAYLFQYCDLSQTAALSHEITSAKLYRLPALRLVNVYPTNTERVFFIEILESSLKRKP